MRKRAKLKNKKRKFLSDYEKRNFAQELIDGKMIKQLIAKYQISAPYGYQIFRELLEYRVHWRLKDLKIEQEIELVECGDNDK